MKIKTFESSSSRKLNRKLDAFLRDPTIEVLRVHFEATMFNAWVLVEYESPTG